MQPQPPPPSTSGHATLPVTIRSELEWTRYNTMQEADAVFNSQQVRRANLHPSTMKAYDIYRETLVCKCVTLTLPSLYNHRQVV